MKNKCNFSVRLKKNTKGSIEEQNSKLIKIFNKKFKKSGILKELRDKRFPVTRGMKKRAKKKAGKRRAEKNKPI
tara:strand:+ start:19513 stop:19734 length:222 start_codon:yes stop_codon:yes gene_type:complete